jgi:hypothetical protein
VFRIYDQQGAGGLWAVRDGLNEDSAGGIVFKASETDAAGRQGAIAAG